MNTEYYDQFVEKFNEFNIRLLSTFPEDKNIIEFNTKIKRVNMSKLLIRYIQITHPFDKQIVGRDTELFNNELFILPNINISKLWKQNINASTKLTVWSYLQMLYLYGQMALNKTVNNDLLNNILLGFKEEEVMEKVCTSEMLGTVIKDIKDKITNSKQNDMSEMIRVIYKTVKPKMDSTKFGIKDMKSFSKDIINDTPENRKQIFKPIIVAALGEGADKLDNIMEMVEKVILMINDKESPISNMMNKVKENTNGGDISTVLMDTFKENLTGANAGAGLNNFSVKDLYEKVGLEPDGELATLLNGLMEKLKDVQQNNGNILEGALEYFQNSDNPEIREAVSKIKDQVTNIKDRMDKGDNLENIVSDIATNAEEVLTDDDTSDDVIADEDISYNVVEETLIDTTGIINQFST
jgi:hypothetical protein